ncbi:MAG: hypothetical protein RI948_998 [Bacteroidota bacterium]|jgi:hypothetical protein
MKKSIFFFALLAFSFSSLKAQMPRFGLGLDLLGPVGIASANITLDLNEQVQLTAGGGLIGAYGGVKYYFNPYKELRFYTGIHYTSFVRYYDFDIFSGFYTGSASGLYIPLGIQVQKSAHFYASFELAFRSLNTGMEPYSPVYPCVKYTYKF